MKRNKILQVRGIFGGGNKDESESGGQGGNVQTASYASTSEKKEVTRANATSNVSSLVVLPQIFSHVSCVVLSVMPRHINPGWWHQGTLSASKMCP